MPKRASKSDVNELAYGIVAQVTQAAQTEPAKNPAAVALGRLGAKKGGEARAAALSPGHRKAIARRAAKARWSKKR